MSICKSGISDKVREMVQKINEVGLKRIVDYCDVHRPRMNIRRQIVIVRSVAKKGYVYAGYELGISKQAAEQALKRMYSIALEIEENGKCKS